MLSDQPAPRESRYRLSRNFVEQRPTSSYSERNHELKRRQNGPVVCFRWQQLGHILQGCRNLRVISDDKRDELSKSTKEETEKANSELKERERHNKSIRQTRFQELTDNVSGSSDDSSAKSGNEARTDSIAIEVNAMIQQEEQEDTGTHRVPLVDPRTQEIALQICKSG